MDMMMWSERHRPKRVEQMVGNEEARLAALKWLSGWVSGAKPLLLVGPAGTGKTTLAQALARQFDYDLVEMNASDTRNRDSLQARISPVFNNVSLLGRKMMLFIDEVDGISGREDTGGLDALVELMKEPTVPVIMAANEKSAKIKDLAKVCKAVELRPVPPRLLLMYLDHVLAAEGAGATKKLAPGDRMAIARGSRGDLRTLLNSAQSRAAGYATAAKDPVDIDIADAINGFFGGGAAGQGEENNDDGDALAMLSRADASYPDPRFEGMSPESRRKDMIGALYSSIVSSHPDPDSLAALLDVLSKADMIVGRAGRNRHWRLLRYVGSILAHGLYGPSRQKGIKYSQYSVPWPVMGSIFGRGQTTRRLLSAVTPAVHMSRSTCGSVFMPYFLRVLADAKESDELDLAEFSVSNFGDETLAAPLAKELERLSGSRRGGPSSAAAAATATTTTTTAAKEAGRGGRKKSK